MINIDWAAVAVGLAVGVALSVAFFAGLGLGMQAALRSAHPVRVLLLSAGLRIFGLLGVGWLVVAQAGPWSLAGYAVAFFLVRVIATTVARAGLPTGGAV